MARTVVLVAALLLLLLLVMSNRATPALHCGAIGVDVHAEAAGIAMGHGAKPAVECQAIGADVHAEAAGIVTGPGAMPALECQTIGIGVQAEAAGVVMGMGHGAMPSLECRAIEVHAEAAETSDFISVATSLDGSAANFHFEAKKLGYRPSDSELDELESSRYAASLAGSPAQLLLEEASVKQLAGKKGTPVVHQCQVSADVPEDEKKTGGQAADDTTEVTWFSSPVKQRDARIISEAAGFPSDQVTISNRSQNQVIDISSLDQRVRPGERSSYGASGNWNHCGVRERSGITARANISESSVIQKASCARAGRDGRLRVEHTGSVVPGSLATSSGHSVLQYYNKKDNEDSFCNESLASLFVSPDDTSAQDAGIVKVVVASAMFSMALLWITVGIKWKTPRKLHIVLTALLLVYITHVESVEPEAPTIPVSFDLKNFDPTFIQAGDELVVNTNCRFEDGHYIMPEEGYAEGEVKPPPRWIRTDSVGSSGKESSVLQRGDTLYLLAFFDGDGLMHFMGEENAPLFPGAHMLPFGESYTSLCDTKKKDDDEEDEDSTSFKDTVDYLVTVPLGELHTEVANVVLSDYTSATPVQRVRDAILTYTITLGESQRIKSLGDRLRKNWEGTTYLTREEAKDILLWDKLCGKWCAQKLGELTNKLNQDLAKRGLYSIDAINNTIDLVKWPRMNRGRCEQTKTQE